MAWKKTYSVQNDTLNGTACLSKLIDEIEESSIATLLTDPKIQVGFDDVDDLDIWFESELSSGDQTTLGTVVGTHDGSSNYVRFIGSSKLVELEKSITESTFVIMGGVVTSVGSLIPDLSRTLGRVIGSIETDGTVELRVMEDGITLMQTSVYQHGDTSSTWETFKFLTTVEPSSGDHEYTLEARLVGATTATIRFVSLSTLEKIE